MLLSVPLWIKRAALLPLLHGASPILVGHLTLTESRLSRVKPIPWSTVGSYRRRACPAEEEDFSVISARMGVANVAGHTSHVQDIGTLVPLG